MMHGVYRKRRHLVVDRVEAICAKHVASKRAGLPKIPRKLKKILKAVMVKYLETRAAEDKRSNADVRYLRRTGWSSFIRFALDSVALDSVALETHMLEDIMSVDMLEEDRRVLAVMKKAARGIG